MPRLSSTLTFHLANEFNKYFLLQGTKLLYFHNALINEHTLHTLKAVEGR